MMTEERIWPDLAIPPGATLAETLEAMGISQAELARRAGRPVQAISEINRRCLLIPLWIYFPRAHVIFLESCVIQVRLRLRHHRDSYVIRIRLAKHGVEGV